MEERALIIHGTYVHFKNKLYHILGVTGNSNEKVLQLEGQAIETETEKVYDIFKDKDGVLLIFNNDGNLIEEKYVYYQALYGDHLVYLRRYDMFMSKVDKAKYPKCLHEYRFEFVGKGGIPVETKKIKSIKDLTKTLENKNTQNDKHTSVK